MVPEMRFGIATAIRRRAMFTAANFPGASTTQLTNARALYAMLTGRVSQILGNARLNETTTSTNTSATASSAARLASGASTSQDTWRVRPNLTINAGLRYEVQLPFTSKNNSYSTATLAEHLRHLGRRRRQVQPVQARHADRARPQLRQLHEGHARPTTPTGTTSRRASAWPGRRTSSRGGSSATARRGRRHGLRAGYAVAYERAGMADFSDVFGDNPGVSIAVNPQTATRLDRP